MIIKRIGLLLIVSMFSWQAAAADRLYSVFSLGLTDLEMGQYSNVNFAYKFGFGYQFHRQWYVEAGYQQLGYDKLYTSNTPTANDVIKEKSFKQGDALFLAFLGKSSSNQGELFYRFGMLKTDVQGQDLHIGTQECEFGQGSSLDVVDLGTATLCEYDNSGIAAVIGLGFDYFIGARTLIRTEIEYIKGEDDLTASALFVGLRYNF